MARDDLARADRGGLGRAGSRADRARWPQLLRKRPPGQLAAWKGLQHVRCPKERPCPHTYIEARASNAPPRKPQMRLESSVNSACVRRFAGRYARPGRFPAPPTVGQACPRVPMDGVVRQSMWHSKSARSAGSKCTSVMQSGQAPRFDPRRGTPGWCSCAPPRVHLGVREHSSDAYR